ncbi:MAG TPA: NAD(P)/FAD-dependent oxidoreductase [Tepidiformaceae bacterium]|nr:NAD(P)/FAD-dependent oxidoreductase [Tepidiformaceae bacterium]
MSNQPPRELDALIVGAGFAGLYQLLKLRQAGFTAHVVEAGDGVGGTWYWNRYPGARCDIESLQYQYGFDESLAKEWRWSEKYATQPEILEYINWVADRFDLRRDIQLETRVTAAHFNESTNRWDITTDKGDHFAARFCIMATGCLSAAKVPDIKGLDTFEGEWYHTGAWPHEGVDFTGKTVGVIGTGSSGIQSIPLIAQQAKHLTVFQRTANFSVPAHNGPLDEDYRAQMTANFGQVRAEALTTPAGFVGRALNNKSALAASEEERKEVFEDRWAVGGFSLGSAFNDIGINIESNEIAAEFVRSKIREIVKDPEVAELLCPRDYPIMTKRLCVDTGYYDTFNRENVKLVNIKDNPIEEITPAGLRTGTDEYTFDVIVFATGFDAMTGALNAIDIQGRGGEKLRDHWVAGPRTYLGLQVAGFPNLFTITGPGSPSVLTNMIASIEQHVDWITDCVEYLRERNVATIEPDQKAEDEWVEHVNTVASFTLFPRANSWYIGANIPGKPRVFMPYVGGLGLYGQKCQQVAEAGYEGFVLGAADREKTRRSQEAGQRRQLSRHVFTFPLDSGPSCPQGERDG